MSLTVARHLSLAVPVALALLAARAERHREPWAAALLAFVAALVGLAGLHEVNRHTGWYVFAPVDGAYRGFPVDLWLGWAVLWGPLPVLLHRILPVPVALGLLLWADAVTMPLLHPLVRLGPTWLVGEVIGLLAVALPAQLLGRWTVRKRRLGARVTLQLVVFAALTLWLVPSVAIELGDGSWSRLTRMPLPHLFVLGQVYLLLAVPALAAVTEFARRGAGTPFPWDPPPAAGHHRPVRLSRQSDAVRRGGAAAAHRSGDRQCHAGPRRADGGGVQRRGGPAARAPRPGRPVRATVAGLPAAGTGLVAAPEAVPAVPAGRALAGRGLRTVRGDQPVPARPETGGAATRTRRGTPGAVAPSPVRDRRRAPRGRGGRCRPRTGACQPWLGLSRLAAAAARGRLAGPGGDRRADRAAPPGRA